MAAVSGSCTGVDGSGNGPSMSAASGAQAQTMLAVWEWQDDQGFWRPYSGQVCVYIERCVDPRLFRGGGIPAAQTISLGQTDPSLSQYLIDLTRLKQFRQDTGTSRSVRRALYVQSSGLSSGVHWEWANDEGGWTPYETLSSVLVEDSFQARQASADLTSHGYDYIIDLLFMVQLNKSTSFKRPVRRQCTLPYPLATAMFPGTARSLIAAFPTRATSMPSSILAFSSSCTCHRCLTRSIAGPRGTRSSLLYSPSTRRVVPLFPPPAYSPYPRRSFSGLMSWSSPWLPGNSTNYPSTPALLENGTTNQRPATTVRKPEEVIEQFMQVVPPVDDQDCIICLDQLSTPSTYEVPARADGGNDILPEFVGKLVKCGHVMHMVCMLAMYNNGPKDGSLQCPCCKTIYGEKTGNQPKGKMEIYNMNTSLPGHAGYQTIQIIYTIVPGVQGSEHPNPGKPYTCRGFPRHCFIPDTPRGRKVLELLKVAWVRRLIFTVGTSSTTGESDTVVWNGIHHKTEMMSNSSGHGYPDPNYLDNVLSELAGHGVTESCL